MSDQTYTKEKWEIVNKGHIYKNPRCTIEANGKHILTMAGTTQEYYKRARLIERVPEMTVFIGDLAATFDTEELGSVPPAIRKKALALLNSLNK